jgi:hypothetical protein
MLRVQLPEITTKQRAWNKGRFVGQERPLLPKQFWAIRVRYELANNLKGLAMFMVAIDICWAKWTLDEGHNIKQCRFYGKLRT